MQAGDEVLHQLVAQVLESLKVGEVILANSVAGQNRVITGEEDVYFTQKSALKSSHSPNTVRQTLAGGGGGLLTGDVGICVSLAAIEALAGKARVGHEPGRFANLLGRVAVGVAKDTIVELSVAEGGVEELAGGARARRRDGSAYQITATRLLPASSSWCSPWNLSGMTTKGTS